jgi:hypothetical protein
MNSIILDFIPSLIALLLTAVVWHIGRQVKNSADRATLAAELVAQKLAESDTGTNKKLNEIHGLVNSHFSQAQEKIGQLEILHREQLAKIDRLEARLFEATGEKAAEEK